MGALSRLADHTLYLVLALAMSLCLVAIAAGQTVDRQTVDRRTVDRQTRAGQTVAMQTVAMQTVDGPDDRDARVRAAIVLAVRARMGSTADVTVRDLRVRTSGELPASLSAVPDIGAQTGGFVRFMLFDRDAPGAQAKTAARARRTGTVDARVFVAAAQLKARTAIARGAQVNAEDVEPAIGDIGRQPLKVLPQTAQVVGAKTIRAIAPGETIAAAMLVMPPLVQSGDEVKTRVRIGELEARGIAVAAQSGALGDEITLVNANSHRRLKGRVIGEREVEVLH